MTDDYREALEVERHQEAKHARREMEQLEATKALNAALADAQGEFPTIGREKTVKTGTYSFSYAELGTIIAAVRPVLVKHGLAISQQLEHNGTGPALRTELRHKDGGIITTTFPLSRVPESPQQLGSLLTYLRRYAITALLGIATEDDDDARQATEQPQQFKAPAATGGLPITEPQTKKIFLLRDKLVKAGVFTVQAYDESMQKLYGTQRVNELNREQARELIDRLEAVEPT